MAHQHRDQALAVQEVQHACLLVLDHLFAQVRGAEMNIYEVLHVLQSLHSDAKVLTNFAVDAVGTDKIGAVDGLHFFRSMVLGTDLHAQGVLFHPTIARLVEDGIRSYDIVELFGQLVLAEVVRICVGESTHILVEISTVAISLVPMLYEPRL